MGNTSSASRHLWEWRTDLSRRFTLRLQSRSLQQRTSCSYPPVCLGTTSRRRLPLQPQVQLPPLPSFPPLSPPPRRSPPPLPRSAALALLVLRCPRRQLQEARARPSRPRDRSAPLYGPAPSAKAADSPRERIPKL